MKNYYKKENNEEKRKELFLLNEIANIALKKIYMNCILKNITFIITFKNLFKRD